MSYVLVLNETIELILDYRTGLSSKRPLVNTSYMHRFPDQLAAFFCPLTAEAMERFFGGFISTKSLAFRQELVALDLVG